MTLLEPEMLMMAVQSGNSLFPANSVYHRFLKKRLGIFVLGLDGDGEECRWGYI